MSCPSQCYTIGGPWITYDPDCPQHGYDAQREDRKRRTELQEKEERISSLEGRVEELERRIQNLAYRIDEQ